MAVRRLVVGFFCRIRARLLEILQSRARCFEIARFQGFADRIEIAPGTPASSFGRQAFQGVESAIRRIKITAADGGYQRAECRLPCMTCLRTRCRGRSGHHLHRTRSSYRVDRPKTVDCSFF